MVGLGNIAEREDRMGEAETLYRRALTAKPNYADAHANLGIVLAAVGRREAAITSFRRALAIDPDCANAHTSLGHALIAMGDWPGALAALDRALTLAPEHVDARINRATARLLTRDFTGGWRDYLARDAKQSVGLGVHRDPLPAKLDGHRLLVLADQGIGDELFFLRFAPALKARGAAVYYRASGKIAAMVARTGAVDRVLDQSDTPPDVTLTLSVGDLPYLLGMESARDIPPPLAIPAVADSRAAMAERLAALGPAPRIGVTWRAGTKILRHGLYKEVPRESLAAALADTSATLIALQRQPAPGEVAAFARAVGRDVHDMTGLNESLEDMLALLDLLDDYVCVSNTNVHLRAGAGAASRVLMPHPPEFRWMADGDESPWFPGTRLYRQTAAGDWSAALARLKEDLS
jgi:tetratricopeptide (TPR) repeat protein